VAGASTLAPMLRMMPPHVGFPPCFGPDETAT
jgi:hypothetical protein